MFIILEKNYVITTEVTQNNDDESITQHFRFEKITDHWEKESNCTLDFIFYSSIEFMYLYVSNIYFKKKVI
jgi:hypothetical protein